MITTQRKFSFHFQVSTVFRPVCPDALFTGFAFSHMKFIIDVKQDMSQGINEW